MATYHAEILVIIFGSSPQTENVRADNSLPNFPKMAAWVKPMEYGRVTLRRILEASPLLTAGT